MVQIQIERKLILLNLVSHFFIIDLARFKLVRESTH